MVNYGIHVIFLKDGRQKQQLLIVNFESEIVTIYPSNELIDEIKEFAKDKSEDYDYILINRIDSTHHFLESYYEKNIPEEYKEFYENSIKNWNDVEDVTKMQKLESDMNNSINNIKNIREEVIKLNKLDSKEFIDYMDKLNELSIDPDRNSQESN